MKPQFASLGSPEASPFVSKQPESFYDQWEKLRARERRAWSKAQRISNSAKAWASWEFAAQRLAQHENSF